MNFSQLQQLLINQPKRPGCLLYAKAPMINQGYPGTFNLSLTNYELITTFNSYINYSSDLIFSKLGQMIRFEDWQNFYGQNKPDNRHLGLFHMGDVGGVNIYKNGSRNLSMELAQENIQNIKSLLVNRLGFDIRKFKISYYPGGSVNAATKGKYESEIYIPKDPSYNFWLENGFSKDNLYPDFSRDTLLTLYNSKMISPWGYRNEIHYEHNQELWDIATIENMLYRPVFNSQDKLVEVQNFQHSFGVAAIGFERVQTIVNKLASVHQLTELSSLDECLKSVLPNINYNQCLLLRESLRILSSIFAENKYQNLRQNRKEKVRKFIRLVKEILKINQISWDASTNALRGFVKLNSQIRFYYPELKDNQEQIFTEIIARLSGLN